MNQASYKAYISILKKELIPALGCTEPIALAYAAAKARSVLGCFPEHIDLKLSGNIIKNVQSVTVPNSEGLKGSAAAAILGAVGGNADKQLEVLMSVTHDDVEKTRELLKTDFCKCELVPNVENLYIHVIMTAGEHTSEVEMKNSHTDIAKIVKDGKVLEEKCGQNGETHSAEDLALLNIKDILEFADTVDLDDIKDVLDRQIEMNTAISREGLQHEYGAQVGRTLLQTYGDDIKIRAKAAAAAGSDARMSGCALPVVINSGSGNQGITVSVPVIEFAKEIGASQDKLYRALIVSNLTAIHQKKYIGKLSAYCGAVSAGCGSGAGITYLMGGNYDDVCATITNTIANVGGIVCDGAKPSCAAKIASSVDAAIMAYYMGKGHHMFKSGEGIVKDGVEKTIESIGRVGRCGMKSTDEEILHIMIDDDKK